MPADDLCDRAYAEMSDLLFLTTRSSLKRLTSGDRDLLESLPGHCKFSEPIARCHDAMTKVRETREGLSNPRGVVILANHEEIPGQIRFCLDPDSYPTAGVYAMPQIIGLDTDKFVVWSDDIYGSSNESGLADIPVSRMPVGRAEGSLLASFGRTQATASTGVAVEEYLFPRPFYDHWVRIGDTQGMRLAPPASSSAAAPDDRITTELLAKDLVYLVLHGASETKRAFWGTGHQDEVVNDALFQEAFSTDCVAFLGVCWGGLPTIERAETLLGAAPPYASRTVNDSIAFTLAHHGAKAVIGFAGFHPVGKETETVLETAQTLHRYFWQSYARPNLSPAEALFDARARLIRDAALGGHLDKDTSRLPFILKVFWSATCFGLGW